MAESHRPASVTLLQFKAALTNTIAADNKGPESSECCLFPGPVKRWWSWHGSYCSSAPPKVSPCTGVARSGLRGRLSMEYFHTTQRASWKGTKKSITLSRKMRLWEIETWRTLSVKSRMLFLSPAVSLSARKTWAPCSVPEAPRAWLELLAR